ncbi:MAG: hypothetical protein A4E39_00355 [Methanoregulaceae archaeon PtaB.Bin152]|nr:MAG: hypothetical protein A4E39_00355 [Methanoregulaceae archaeon PtaB.Bin152]
MHSLPTFPGLRHLPPSTCGKCLRPASASARERILPRAGQRRGTPDLQGSGMQRRGPISQVRSSRPGPGYRGEDAALYFSRRVIFLSWFRGLSPRRREPYQEAGQRLQAAMLVKVLLLHGHSCCRQTRAGLCNSAKRQKMRSCSLQGTGQIRSHPGSTCRTILPRPRCLHLHRHKSHRHGPAGPCRYTPCTRVQHSRVRRFR